MPDPRRRALLSDLVIDEVAFCAEGMNPEAGIMLYKAKPEELEKAPCDAQRRRARRRRRRGKPGDRRRARSGGELMPPFAQARKAILEAIEKLEPEIAQAQVDELHEQLHELDHLAKQDDDDEPPTFEEMLDESRMLEIDSALDRRAHALIRTTTEIMRAEGFSRDERRDAVLEAVTAYAATMDRDVPELFAGRLAKWLEDWEAESPQPADVEKAVTAELEGAGLLPDPNGGHDAMDFLKALTERGQRALKYIAGDTDPAELFKGIGDDAGKVVAALFDKAAEAGETIAVLTGDLAKARADHAGTLTPDQALAKAIETATDPGVAAMLKAQDAALRKQDGKIEGLEKAARTARHEAIAKRLPNLPNADGALVVMLGKAETAGFLGELETVLQAAETKAELAKSYEELGIETTVGDGSVGTPAEADQALVTKAGEIQKATPSLTPEQAYAKACEQNQDLYQQTRTYRPSEVN